MERRGRTSRCRAVASATAIVVATLLVSGPTAKAASYRIDPDRSDLVVVTRKAGIAAGLAHDHVVAATDYEASLSFDADDPAEAWFEIVVPASGLLVDDPSVRARVVPRLIELDLLEETGGSLSDKDRGKIKKAMLGARQLDADAHPTIVARAEVVDLGESPTEATFPATLALTLEVRGVPVTTEAVARYRVDDRSLAVEAHAEFRFTDFGIEPYSAFLGAVRNRDTFHVHVRLTAVKDGDTAHF